MEADGASLPVLQQLSTVLNHEYGITPSTMVPLRSVTGIVDTDGMRYIWKSVRARDTDRRLAVLAFATREMADAGLPAAGPLPAQDGRFRVQLPDGTEGYLQPWLSGRHARFGDVSEKLTTVTTLAWMHSWSAQQSWLFDPAIGGPEWLTVSGGRLEVKVSEKWRVLRRVWPFASANCALLKEVEEDFFEAGEAVVDALRAYREYLDANRNAAPEPSGRLTAETVVRAPATGTMAMCHRDLAPHNVLWLTARWPAALIDFDHAGCDDPLIDLMQVSNHTFSLCDPGPTHLPDLLAAYERISPLTPVRKALLGELLRFPDILVRTVMEWARDGFVPAGQSRIIRAVAKERTRRLRLAQAKGGS